MLEDDPLDFDRALHGSTDEPIDSLLDRTMNGDDSEAASNQLRWLAAQERDDSPDALLAMQYYRKMRATLSEEDFRWFAMGEPDTERKKMRRDRLVQYGRYRELFELEVEAAHRQRASLMAVSHDWSNLGAHTRNALRRARSRWMLRLAAVLYRAGVPGAVDICDAAAFNLFRTAYLSA